MFNKGDLLWFDNKGIGSETPLSYFGWDFDDCAVIENIDGNKVVILITDQETKDEIRISTTLHCLEKMIIIPEVKYVRK